jgi:hypothetical protein
VTLQLVTGPTNASKAGVVLGLVRRWGAENRAPVLVVPTGPDAVRYRRELLRVSGGVTVGVQVVTFGPLAELVRRAVGLPAATLGPLARERLLAAALTGVPAGRPLGRTADRPGVRRRLDGLLEELAERGFGPEQLHADLDVLDPLEHGVDGQLVDDLRVVLQGVAASSAGLVDGQGHPLPTPATQAREVRLHLSADPGRWGGRPVAFYGFDDLTFGQLALVRTLARAADVVVSLPYEDDRVATAARREVVAELRAVAADVAGRSLGATGALPLQPGAPELRGAAVAAHEPREVALQASGAEGGRGRLERRLFEPRPAEPTGGATPPAEQYDDVVLVEGGSARAEAEALADQLLSTVDELALSWHDVAIAVRDADGAAGARLERELTARGVPVARPRDVPARRTATGAAIAALARIRTATGTADDVVLVLRAGSSPANVEAVDGFALALRRAGVADAGTAEVRAHQYSPTLEGLDLLGAVPADRRAPGAERLLEGLLAALPALEELLAAATGPRERDPELAAARRIREHLTALSTLAAADAALVPGPEELAEELADLPVPVGTPPGRGLLEIAAPPALRGRQVAVLALADLRESAFPSAEPVDPRVDRDAREVLARAGGTTLGLPVARLAAERVLFLELVARPTRRLVLSRPTASDAGEALPPAPFLADVHAALHPGVPLVVSRRASAVRAPLRRSLAVAAPFGAQLDGVGREAVRRALLERTRFAVREVERLARCPVCWIVEHLAGAEDDTPDSEAQIHGNLVHRLLDRVLVDVASGGVPYGDLVPAELVAAGRRALLEEGPRATAGLPEHRARVLLRRVDVGVSAVLTALPERYATAALQATEVVVGDDGSVPAVDLGDGAHAVGRVDRIDAVPLPDGSPGLGVVDYKLGAGGAVGAGRWAATATLQAALYASAVGTVRTPVAYALYQPTAPISGIDPGARPPAGAELRGTLVPRGGLAGLDDVSAAIEGARRIAVAAVAAVRSGAVTPLPGGSVHGDEGVCDHAAVARLLP